MTEKGKEMLSDTVRYDFFDIGLGCDYLSSSEVAEIMEVIKTEQAALCLRLRHKNENIRQALIKAEREDFAY